MKRWLLGFILSVYAHAAQSATNEVYLGSRESDPASIVENVSVIYGDYTEIEVDFTVNAPDSLILSRFYSSRDTLSVASLGGWRFNPHCYLIVEKDPESGRISVRVGDPTGSILTYQECKYDSHLGEQMLFKIDVEKGVIGFANTAKGDINAWTNLKNTADYGFTRDPSGLLVLATVIRSDKPDVHYTYQVERGHALLIRKTLPEGRFVHVDYYIHMLNEKL